MNFDCCVLLSVCDNFVFVFFFVVRYLCCVDLVE